MSDDSPLGNIREQLDEAEGATSEEDATSKTEPIVEEDREEDEGGPWFPFAESKQRPMYPHEDRWEELEDAKFEMEVLLRQAGIKDVEGRELDDAILEYAIENPEEVVEHVLRARGELEEES